MHLPYVKPCSRLKEVRMSEQRKEECKHCGVEFSVCCDHRCFCGETGPEDDYYWDEYGQRVLKEKGTDV
jgi:hypothetical protein